MRTIISIVIIMVMLLLLILSDVFKVVMPGVSPALPLLDRATN